jgi:hypothetical protein
LEEAGYCGFAFGCVCTSFASCSGCYGIAWERRGGIVSIERDGSILFGESYDYKVHDVRKSFLDAVFRIGVYALFFAYVG